jgi:hypothetical protein
MSAAPFRPTPAQRAALLAARDSGLTAWHYRDESNPCGWMSHYWTASRGRMMNRLVALGLLDRDHKLTAPGRAFAETLA